MSVRDISWRGEHLLPHPLRTTGPTSAKRYTVLPPTNVNAISVHHTTGIGLPASSTVAQEITYLRAIDAYHRLRRGLDAIGYQLVAFASGRVYVTAPLDRYGAAVGGQNNHTISVALPGDFSTKPPSPGHLRAAATAVAHVDAYLGRKVAVRPHYYWGRTACPGRTYATWAAQLRPFATRYHTVVHGDTAWGIAVARRISLARLKALNPSGPRSGDWDLIYPGERLRVA